MIRHIISLYGDNNKPHSSYIAVNELDSDPTNYLSSSLTSFPCLYGEDKIDQLFKRLTGTNLEESLATKQHTVSNISRENY